MYENILVAVDGSEQSDEALKTAIHFAKHHNSVLLITHVLDTRNFDFPVIAGYVRRELWDQYTKAAEDLLETSKENAEAAGLEQVQTILKKGSPRYEIPETLTKEYDIDLLMVGERGRNATERMIVGSVAEACMRRSPCDVLTVKNEASTTLYRNILVAVDGSEHSEQALAKAIEIANAQRATLNIACVLEWGNFEKSIVFYQPNYMADAQKDSENMLQRYKEQAEEQGMENVHTILHSGNPRLEIPRVLTIENNIDLLITADTGQHAVSRFVTGSVAESSVRHSPRDVLTVKNESTKLN
ncbi:universal stress protein [Salicibibacter halophilus]|uniref:Universal stress protein n=1 Tax=Salicibibacter halophilus TaxID=2502791 RepID=A0A514LHV3_9BACI|nr:universal stress protein [Salicibibacter halophilus]QDI91430.1 universal stress protein [Salicibibacter halophilus]